MNNLSTQVQDNLSFVLVCILCVAAMVGIAVAFERAGKKKSGSKERILSTWKVVMIGMFSALSGILYCLDFPIPIAPSFYKLDFSELPALIGGFAFGPVAGVLIEFIKVVIKLLIKSTSTAFVGDLANFLIGTMLVLPASVLYQFKKSRRMAIAGCIAGTLTMTIFGTMFNALYLLPAFSRLYGMPLEAILSMGSAVNASVRDLWSFVFLMVAPLNLLKGAMVSILTILIYKKVSPVIKFGVEKRSGKGRS